MTKNSSQKPLDRRAFLSAGTVAGAGLGLGLPAAHAAGPEQTSATPALDLDAAMYNVVPDTGADQTLALEIALGIAARRSDRLRLRPGTYIVNGLNLPFGAQLIGSGQATVLKGSTKAPVISAKSANNIRLADMTLDGSISSQNLIRLKLCLDFHLTNLVVRSATGDNIHLAGCSGTITHCDISLAGSSGLHAVDSLGLNISHNTLQDCANNGIQIWRSEPGNDGSLVANNRICKIRAKAGGTGQNGNGINVFRADNVQVNSNHITDCEYSAIRGNAASNIQMVANHCQRIGEVALYAEFGFQGALIANNIIDTAATGISVTNFNEGGRLAVVQGNLIRNLFRREHEPEDKRGNGIAIEADASVTGNTIESAPTAGIIIGWGFHMRDVAATGNLIRQSRYGILMSSSSSAGACFIATNMIAGASDGAIRAHDKGRVHGPDLAERDDRSGRVAIMGNVSV